MIIKGAANEPALGVALEMRVNGITKGYWVLPQSIFIDPGNVVEFILVDRRQRPR